MNPSSPLAIATRRHAATLFRSATRRRAAAPPVRPQLTSLVDMLTILLVFLLKSFSVEGDLMSPAAGLRLPTSNSRDRAVPEVSVEVTRTEIRVDGRPVVTLAELGLASSVAAAPDAGTAAAGLETIPALARALAATPAAGPDDPDDPAGRAVTIHRDQEYGLLERVMATCSRAGFSDFSLLVTREES